MIKLKDLLADLFKPLNEEMSYNDLLKLSDSGRKERSAHVRSRSIPVSLEDGNEAWNFRYKSNPSTTDRPFEGSIQFFKEIRDTSKENAADLPCKVDCSCPDFKYRWAYNDAKAGAADVGPDSLNGNNGQPPKPKGPPHFGVGDLGEGLCKHLIALEGYLRTKITATGKSNLFEAMSDVAKTNRTFNIEYYD